MSGVPLRKACDLCYAQKVGCQRTGSTTPCVRCLKAGSRCTSSISLRNRTRKGSKKQQSSDNQDPDCQREKNWTSSADADFDLYNDSTLQGMNWLEFGNTACASMDWIDDTPTELAFESSVIVNSNRLSETHNSSGTADTNETTPPPGSWALMFPDTSCSSLVPLSTCAESLPITKDNTGKDTDLWLFHSTSEKAVELDPESAAVPNCSHVIHEEVMSRLVELNLELFKHSVTLSMRHVHLESFAIDDTFQLLQKLIYVCNDLKFNRRTSSSSESQQESNPDIHQHTASDANADISHIDPGTHVLILSSYVRVLEIFAVLFGNVQSSFVSDQTSKENLKLPKVSVGHFSIASNSVIQLTLVLQIAEQMLCQLGDSIRSTGLTVILFPPQTLNDTDENWTGSTVDGVERISLQAALCAMRALKRHL